MTEVTSGEESDGVAASAGACGGKALGRGSLAAEAEGALMEGCVGTIGTPRGSEFEDRLTSPFYWGPTGWRLPRQMLLPLGISLPLHP